MANLCDRLKCLPEPGGLYQQNVRTLTKLESALRALDDVSEKKIDIKSKTNDNR